MVAVVLGVLFFLLSPPGFTAQTDASPVAKAAPADLSRGRWDVLFVVIPGCPVCGEAVAWLGRAEQVFPDSICSSWVRGAPWNLGPSPLRLGWWYG